MSVSAWRDGPDDCDRRSHVAESNMKIWIVYRWIIRWTECREEGRKLKKSSTALGQLETYAFWVLVVRQTKRCGLSTPAFRGIHASSWHAQKRLMGLKHRLPSIHCTQLRLLLLASLDARMPDPC